jgi:peptidyl-Lys metalloendopeptidase
MGADSFSVGSAYNFTSSGEGSYNIEAANLFYYVDPSTGKAATIRADTTDATHSAKLTGKLATTARTTGLARRIEYQSCSDDQQSTLVEAAAAAQSYAEESQS